ncbi:MAG: hypothetical protein Q4B99_06320 [Clostridia bacterium]|nr:hypothetical protein [Clostridia bacterium]
MDALTLTVTCMFLLIGFTTADFALKRLSLTRFEALYAVACVTVLHTFDVSPIQELKLDLGALALIAVLCFTKRDTRASFAPVFSVAVASLTLAGILRLLPMETLLIVGSLMTGATSAAVGSDAKGKLLIASVIPPLSLALCELLCLVTNGYCEFDMSANPVLAMQLLSMCACCAVDAAVCAAAQVSRSLRARRST